MRDRFLHLVIVAVGLSPFVVASMLAQEPPQEPQGRGGRGGSVQVGVPEGRGGAPARQGGPGRGTPPPAKPAPRGANGRVLLGGATPSEKGVWLPGNGGAQAMVEDVEKVPFQPWAKALLAERRRNQLEPHTRCKPSGFVRQFLTPYGVEIVELAEMDRVYIFDIGGPHTYRTIYTDGRTHPANLQPSFYGHSIGWWEGDTLVVDTTGFNESFWMDRRGLPHTEKLRTLERFTRTDSRTIKYEVTVDDPSAYTAPWTSQFNLGWEAGTELFEYVCQEANYAHTLMVGDKTSVDRTSAIVP
jgi:hypothetical protein